MIILNFFRNNYIQRTPTQTGSTGNTTTTTTTAANEPANQQNVADDGPKPKEYDGPYSENIEGKQMFVFVIPVLDIDQPAFISGIESI